MNRESAAASLSPECPIAPVQGTTYYRIDDADILLRARIRRSLSATGRRQLALIRVTAQGGRVTLQGNVPSYYMKQIAQQAAMSVDGVERLDSLLTVE